MYIPSSFAVRDLATLHDFIERHSFGLLLSQVNGEPFGTHIPFLVDRDRGEFGTLLGHVARANPHWRTLADQPGFAVFSGPHAYISPTWYQAEAVVPTWNYTAVHAYGRITLVEDEATLIDLLTRTVAVYEQIMPAPWSFDPAAEYVGRMAAQIVGFRFEITKLEGKFKLNQNHPPERRERVIGELDTRGTENERAIADAMRQTLA